MYEITEYEIVYAKNTGILSEEVNEMIKRGWQPFGNVHLESENATTTHCHQPMVKYNTPITLES